MGIVLLEAMASGVPIVAANIPGYATVVESGIDGLLTTPCNSQELAQAIIHLLDHQPLCQQFIMMGRQKVHDYAWPQVAKRIIEYYVQLMQERDTCSRFVIPSS
jgi:phosphatidylinositol alpha-mannosyltransferase